MVVVVHSPTDQEAESYQLQLVPIYRDAFGKPPYHKEEAEVVDFAQSFPRHVHEEGFRLVVARQELRKRIVGFAYGYANTPDQFWYEQVAKAVEPRTVKEWLVGSFRLVEMAVAPEAQGQGAGGLLHDRLLRGVPYQRAVLSTIAAETNAYGLYRKRGWRVLLDDLAFPGVARRYRIMGLELCREDRASLG
jgi:GNAT superfamily N-acetyltransferase